MQGWAYLLPENEWVHIVGIMSEDPTQLYVNGELFEGTGKGPGGAFSNAANLFRIGSSGTIGEYFNGVIDEVGIFNVALTEDEINDIMNEGITGLAAVSPSGKLATTWAAIKK